MDIRNICCCRKITDLSFLSNVEHVDLTDEYIRNKIRKPYLTNNFAYRPMLYDHAYIHDLAERTVGFTTNYNIPFHYGY